MNVDNRTHRQSAAELYWAGYTMAEISERLSVNYKTIDSWRRRDEWDKAGVTIRVNACAHTRLCQLIAKADKSDRDFKEIDSLGKLIERTARIDKFKETGKPSDINPKLKNRPNLRANKNAFSEDCIDKLDQAFNDNLFDYQRHWSDNRHHRIRNILKSRQIGATWYFAREAIHDAVLHGDNQIFLSASKAQAHVFKAYIVDFVRDVTGIELKGDPIKLWNGATLYFLGTNSRTAQSYHGHLYFDEYFWVHQFQKLRNVASGMAMHKKWRQTYISTPSTLCHDAYPFWSGQHFNKRRPKAEQEKFNITHAHLKHGQLCADGQWRQIVNVEDAVAGKCDLFDLDTLALEYAPDQYKNLLMCEFIDAAASVFSLKQLQACMIDSWANWSDFNPMSKRPVGDQSVWIGYDPSRTIDNASLVVVLPPRAVGLPFRVIEKQSWQNISFEEQAKRIKALMEKYNVDVINIDASGIGLGVYELVKKFFPRTRKIIYSVETKTRLVLKGQHLIQNRHIQWDSGWSDLVANLLAIHQTQTTNSRQITYAATRSAEVGHADIAWALFNALDEMALESIDNLSGSKKGFMTWIQ